MTPAHLVLIGGFLGAGKTTAMRRLATFLMDQGLRPALITNDQGHDLVDTQLARHCGFVTEEVTGGCFCCRFDELAAVAFRLTDRIAPDVFVAEAVGSCTDLVATVAKPFRRLYGDRFTAAPVSVLVDPIQARRMLGLDRREPFSADVRYVFEKQIEEADRIVVNKRELLEPADAVELCASLASRAPGAIVDLVSLREDLGLEAWLRAVAFGRQPAKPSIEVDYDRYADGEARLGWLNATIAVSATPAIEGNLLLTTMARALQSRLGKARATVAHLKMTLHDPAQPEALAAINLVRPDTTPEIGMSGGGPIGSARLRLNLRAEGAPDTLALVLERTLAELAGGGVNLTVVRQESFRPARPEPTHRDGSR